MRRTASAQAAGESRSDADIVPLYHHTADDDIGHLFLNMLAHRFHHELKRRKKVYPSTQIVAEIQRVRVEAHKRGKIPALTFRLDNCEPMIVLPLKEVMERFGKKEFTDGLD